MTRNAALTEYDREKSSVSCGLARRATVHLLEISRTWGEAISFLPLVGD